MGSLIKLRIWLFALTGMVSSFAATIACRALFRRW